MNQTIEYIKQTANSNKKYNSFKISDDLKKYYHNSLKLYIGAIESNNIILQDKTLSVMGNIIACIESEGIDPNIFLSD